MKLTLAIVALLCVGIALPSSVNAQANPLVTYNFTNETIPDVLLDVPNLGVDRILLLVENVFANVALNTSVGRLVQLSAGVQASIKKVNLTILDVRARAHLEVRLDNVRKIVERVADTLDRNPNLLASILGAVGAGIAGLVRTVLTSLGTILTIIDNLGNILSRTVGTGGVVLNQNVIGTVLQNGTLISNMTINGNIVSRYFVASLQSVVDVIFNNANQILGTKVISAPVSV
jgi:hypothetical protein